MSIIYDALKKTQHRLQKTFDPQTRVASIEDEKNKPLLWSAILIISLGFIVCGIVFISLVFTKNSAHQTVDQLGTIPPDSINAYRASQALFKSSTPSTKENPNSNEIVLNGIMSMGDEQLALINNKIYKAGDYIGEKRVLSISTEKVEIFDKGKVLTLTTK